MTTRDQFYMQRAIELAQLAYGKTSPNPLVGAVIVKNDKIIAEGFHSMAGKAHAEIEAFKAATEDVSGATLYCTLEPCCHTHKRTPPCAPQVIAKKIKRVVIANLDPNPQVAGKAIQMLKQAGIEVLVGVCSEEAYRINLPFFTAMIKKRCHIHLKWAQGLDGRIATKNGSSKWITGEAARKFVHSQRAGHDAILVGRNTLQNDNPSLTIRGIAGLACKKRIILTTRPHLLPLEHKVFTDEYKSETIIITPPHAKLPIELSHIDNFSCECNGQEFDLSQLSTLLLGHGIQSIYVEGGGKVITSFLKAKIFDEISCYIAPKIMGEGCNAIGDLSIKHMTEALSLPKGQWIPLEKDMLWHAFDNLHSQGESWPN